jgi:hypothetical protein
MMFLPATRSTGSLVGSPVSRTLRWLKRIHRKQKNKGFHLVSPERLANHMMGSRIHIVSLPWLRDFRFCRA